MVSDQELPGQQKVRSNSWQSYIHATQAQLSLHLQVFQDMLRTGNKHISNQMNNKI
ncbi:hypothetical protein ACJIZ3_008214 [Penstemon smallii]|uniref:Uncharacterized protein n=1 Tax=Penstemon smallii TaxID=265156 RepID=A0ABD3TA42_9LAMI